MIQSLVITLREGVEAALVIGIAIAYLNKSGRGDLVGRVYWALGAAVLASIAAAFVLQRLTFNEEAYEGYVLLAAAFFVATMVYWMHRTSKGIKRLSIRFPTATSTGSHTVRTAASSASS